MRDATTKWDPPDLAGPTWWWRPTYTECHWHGYDFQGSWYLYPWFIFGLRSKKIMAQDRSRRIMDSNKETIM
jgi:hypothetical protein